MADLPGAPGRNLDGVDRGERDEAESGLPRHYVRPCILLMLAEGPSHGYEMLEQIRRLGVRGTDPGGLYRSLRAMEKENIVHSWWEPSQAGPARRTYVLTDEGRGAMQGSVESLRSVHRLLSGLLARFDLLAQPSAPPPLAASPLTGATAP